MSGLVRVSRVVRHPRIVVIPRTKAAIQFARGLLAQSALALGAEDIREVREYMPGDPIRRIHWKKSAKLNKLVIKLLQGPGLTGPIILLSYASSPVWVDRVGEVLVYLTAELLTRIPSIEVISVNRDGEITNYTLNRDNYFNVIENILGRIENLNIKLIGGGDYADLLSAIKYSIPLRIKDIVREGIITIGQGLFMEPICRVFKERLICISV